MRRGTHRLEVTNVARQALAALPDPWRDRVRDAIRELANDPEPADSIPMTGRAEGLRRRRVGVYRIVYRVTPARLLVLVVRLGHRSNVYRGLEG